MTTLFPDTTPEAEAVLMELLRKAPAWRKLQMVGELNAAVRTLALSGLRERYPQASPEELRRRLADMLLGPELAEKAYGPLEPEEKHDEVERPQCTRALRTGGRVGDRS